MVEIRIFDDMEQCTDEEIYRMLPFVSAHRQGEALKFKFTFGRFACLKSMIMLQEMVREHKHLTKDIKLTFEYGEHGKPSLKEFPDIHFNISHCKNGIAVAISDKPIGIDIESFHKAEECLVRKTMNKSEEETINNADDSSEMFTIFWTKKEAVLKLHGTGIIDDLHSVLSGDEMIETVTNNPKKYVYSVARCQ